MAVAAPSWLVGFAVSRADTEPVAILLARGAFPSLCANVTQMSPTAYRADGRLQKPDVIGREYGACAATDRFFNSWPHHFTDEWTRHYLHV